MGTEIISKGRHLIKQYKTPILYSGGSIFSAFSQMIVGLAIAKFVSPKDLGLWTTINLALTYSTFLQLGMFNGFGRELPYEYGRGQVKKAEAMAALVQTFTLAISIIVFVIGLSYFLFFPNNDEKTRYGLLAIIFVIILSFFQTYLLVTFRSKNSFLKLSIFQVVFGIVNIFSLFLVVYFSYYGMIVKAIVVTLIFVLLLFIYRPVKVGFVWDKKIFISLLKIGLPIFILSYIQSVATTSDKLWILRYSDLKHVGLYSFGYYAFSTFSLFAYSVASYVYPRMTYNYGKNNDKLLLWNYVKKITIILLIVQIPLAVLGYIFIPMIITTFFTSYILSISAMQILLFAGLFSGCVVGVNVLWSMMDWKYMIIYQVIYIILLVVFPYIGIQLFPNILEGVAYGMLMANVLNFFSGIYITYKALHKI